MTLRRSVLTAAVAGGLSVTLLAGCKSSTSGSGSAPGPAPTGIGGSASSLASKAQSAASSALSEISGGVLAAGDVTAGPVVIDADGHAASQLTVENKTDADHDYTVSVIFDDSGGGLQDVVVVNVSGVPGHGEARATAKSNRKLSGSLTAKVSAAVRH
ncbi:hypothetical protein [Catenulispora subtropica]|uniref:Lipoprotein n=1 Tax=Catenulispora subtropica TaxID=450798 RepID=A0ABN2QYY9_9ACTN